MMNYRFYMIISTLFLVSCQSKDKKETTSNKGMEKAALLEADKAFSKRCEEKGMKNAFIEYIDSNGVLLRPGQLPIIGANAIDYLIQQNDSGYTLSWEPSNGEVCQSGELGYTYGIYAMRPASKDTLIYGTYTSIWKKQKDGSWKFVLDTGNEGIGDQ